MSTPSEGTEIRQRSLADELNIKSKKQTNADLRATSDESDLDQFFKDEDGIGERTKMLPQGSDHMGSLIDPLLQHLDPRWRNWVVRGVFTIVMISLFTLIVSRGPTWLMFLVLAYYYGEIISYTFWLCQPCLLGHMFLVPVALVICCDVMSYMFGFFWGKTPLIKLSPKKTWEGFIGGAISTIIFGLLLSYAMLHSPFMVCPVGEYTEESSNCTIPPPFQLYEAELPRPLPWLMRLLRGVQVDSLILASNDDLWEVARIVDIDRKHSEMAVKILQTGKDVRVLFSQAVPLHPSEVNTVSSDESHAIEPPSGDFDGSNQYTELKAQKYGNVSVGELGDWHGGGFGLKLMQKMGYKLGEGLGKKNDGIVHAIQAAVLPKHKSLDYVMENKKKIRKIDGKTAMKERISKQQQNVSGIEADIFAFINRQFETLRNEEKDDGKIMAKERQQLSEASEKSLVATVFDNEKKIKELRSKRAKLEQGLIRNKGDKKTSERLQTALDQVCREIQKAEGQQTRVQSERDARQRKKDLF
ncbi:unnamed protein product, partial [Mesorhabditis belari]|uniref:phosphatidate cytidylyltransferase n=1 Tax=Mesorhabditis belari TaxID=2138241 RepID=A0AAF3FHQ6_9BILA